MSSTNNTSNLTPLQKAYLLLKDTQTKLENLEYAKNEPIAIIGIGCRFPGGANSPDAFWELLEKGFNGISKVPTDRWDNDTYFDSNPETPGKLYTRSAGFLNTPVSEFDPIFFGISPKEATLMDPQQRLLLEVTWEALENAGINPKKLKGSLSGVFVGIMMHDYSDLLNKFQKDSDLNSYNVTGCATCTLTGRLSYFLGLKGPSFPIDTACSSSLVTLHYACQSLRERDCHLAIVGGVNLILTPEPIIGMCKAKMLAPDGFCKTFDAKADGYARGEGCGIVVLKRLSDAQKDGDEILALIKATGVNQDGASSGLTVPSKESQESLLRHVWSKANVEPGEIDYIEAHGTGTPLGDPIEIRAIESALEGSKRTNPLLIGSVKTNIGHLESAASVAGLIKIILSLKNEAIPPHVHFEKLNPYINMNTIPAEIPISLTPWPKGKKKRIAGLSSFSLGGTNAHAIIEEFSMEEKKEDLVKRPIHILTLSAHSAKALNDLIEKYKLFLKQHPSIRLEDIAFTANTGRADFEYRMAIVAKTSEEAFQKIEKNLYKIYEKPELPPKVAFLFAGEELPDLEIGKTLISTHPIFKENFDKAMNLVQSKSTLFAFEYALYQLWKSFGIIPQYVLGSGVGEYSAAVAAGVVSLEDAAKLILGTTNDVVFHPPKIGLISSVSGKVLSSPPSTNDYLETMQKPRSLEKGIQTLLQLNCKTFLGIGPISYQIAEGLLLQSTEKGKDDWATILESLSQLFVLGIPIDWVAFDKPYSRKIISLPNYPFQRTRLWFQNEDAIAVKSKEKQLAEVQEIETAAALPQNQLLAMPKLVRSKKIKELIQENLCDVLSYQKEELKDNKSFFDMGMDSLTAVQFSKQLQTSLEDLCLIESTTAFNYPTIKQLLAYIEEQLENKVTSQPLQEAAPSIPALSQSEKSRKIRELIQETLCDVLSYQKEELKDNKSFFDIGMDSLTAVQFSKQLQASLENRCVIESTTAFNYPTIKQLSAFIEDQLQEKSNPPTTPIEISSIENNDDEKFVDQIIQELQSEENSKERLV